MPQTTVTARYVNLRNGTRPPSIKGTDNEYYSLNDQQVANVQENATYNIEYSVKRIRDRDYKIVDKITPAQSQAQSQTTQAAANGRAKYTPTDDKTAERIFVCGGFNALMSNQNWDPNVVDASRFVAVVTALRQCYTRTFGGKPTLGDDMGGDDVPFTG